MAEINEWENSIPPETAKALLQKLREPGVATKTDSCWSTSKFHEGKYCRKRLIETDLIIQQKYLPWPRRQEYMMQDKKNRKNFLLHVLAYRATGGTVSSHDEFGQQLDIDHRCHESYCFNPAHVTQSPHSDNMSRIGCPIIIQDQFTQRLVLACNHRPMCIGQSALMEQYRDQLQRDVQTATMALDYFVNEYDV